jgi:ribosomal protein S18 acetylase RimI-like enzyme
LRDQTVLVARDGADPVGFVHIAMGRGLEGWSEDAALDVGCIRFVAHPPGRRDVGDTLLAEAQGRLREMGATRNHAFAKTMSYRFYQLGFGMLPLCAGHTTGLLGSNGYAVRRGEYFLGWRDFEPVSSAAPDTSVEVTVEQTDGGGDLPEIAVRARVGDTTIGVCESEYKPTGAGLTSTDAQCVFYVEWLGVETDFRGRGWGKYLLTRALCEARSAGYRHAAITTDWRNYRALSLYANHGFSVASYAHDYVKVDPDPPA